MIIPGQLAGDYVQGPPEGGPYLLALGHRSCRDAWVVNLSTILFNRKESQIPPDVFFRFLEN
jgi:hypothetical protein